MRDAPRASSARDGRIDVLRPGVDAAGEVIDGLEARALQECDDLRAAGAVMTDTDDGLRRIELAEPGRDLAHRHEDCARARGGDGRLGDLPRFPHVEEHDRKRIASVRRGEGERGRPGQLLHREAADALRQNVKRLGSPKPARRGATVSNNSTVE